MKTTPNIETLGQGDRLKHGSACSERRGFYWEHLTRKTRLVKLKVEQRNSPWSLSSYGMLAGTATTGHQGSTGLPDISQARTVPPSSVLPGYRNPESDTVLSYLPKSDPDCSQRQTTAYTQPQDKAKARGHHVPILKRFFSVSCDAQAEAQASLICARLSLQKPRGLREHGNQVSLFVHPEETNGVTFLVRDQWEELSNFSFPVLKLSCFFSEPWHN